METVNWIVLSRIEKIVDFIFALKYQRTDSKWELFLFALVLVKKQLCWFWIMTGVLLFLKRIE